MLETALQEITVCYSNLPKRTIVLVLAYLTHSARLLAESTLLVWLGEMRLSKICMNARTHRGARVGGMDRFFPCRIVASVVFTGMRSTRGTKHTDGHPLVYPRFHLTTAAEQNE